MLLPKRLAVVIIVALSFSTIAAVAEDAPPYVIPGGPQTIYAPIAGLDEFANWQLAVVNRSPGTMPATITVYSIDGIPFSPVNIVLAGSETRELDIRTLVPREASEKTLGGLSIGFTGQSLGVGAQVTISGHHGFGNVDAPVFPNALYKSNSADAVWWEPSNSRSYLILANSSADTLSVNITHETKKYQLEVAPHATVIDKLRDDRDESGSEAIDSVHIEGTGQPGTLRVTGYTVSDDEKFVNTIRAFDPASSTEPAVYANGLHFSGGTNHLIVKNISTQALRISATIFPLSTGGSSGMISIPPKSVGPGTASELDLSSIGGLATLDGAAIKIESTGPVASVIASFINHSRQNQIVRPSPFKDIGDYSVSTGAYPWRLDGKFESRIYITNVGKVRAAFGGHIVPANGPSYFIDSHYLDVGETTVFDLRQMRDQQVPDPNGVRLPTNAVTGQFEWTTIFGDGSQRFIGRNELLDGTSGISASFSCNSCGCPASTVGSLINPGTVVVTVNGIFASIALEGVGQNGCSGVNTDYTVIPDVWNIDSPNVISITKGFRSSLTGLAPGSSNFRSPFTGTVYAQQSCTPFPVQEKPVGIGNVDCPAPPTSETTSFTGPNQTYGTLSNFSMTLQGGSGNYAGWTIDEYAAQPGVDGCWNSNVNPALVPQYPVISGGPWIVSGNSWGADSVGWLPASVNYIRQNSPLYSNTPIIVPFPCSATVYQALSITCPKGTTPNLYDPKVVQSETVNQYSVQNVREGISSTINQ